MADKLDMILREYYRWLKANRVPIQSSVNYYLQSKYLECKTIPGKNNRYAGMMAGDVTIYELIRDSKMEMLYSGVRYCGACV